jgi:hypothetical protein
VSFKSRELVRVVVLVEGRHVKTVRATATGVFTARFPAVSVRKCTGYSPRAPKTDARSYAGREP